MLADTKNSTIFELFRGISKPVSEELAPFFIRLNIMGQTGYGVPMVTECYGKEAFEFIAILTPNYCFTD